MPNDLAASTVPPQHQSQYEAHVHFELEQLRGGHGKAFVAEELQLAWTALSNQPLSTFVDEERAIELLKRYLCQGNITDELLDAIGHSAYQLLELPALQNITPENMISEENRKDLVEEVVALSKLRQQLIELAVANPLYASTVTDLLYHGIRDYIVAGSELTKKVPGVGSMLNRGSNMLGKRMQAFEDKMEDKIRHYIQSNMQGILERSEKMLAEQLTPERLTQFADEGWRAIRSTPISISGYITAEQTKNFSHTGGAIWEQLRSNSIFQESLSQAVSQFYTDYGQLSIAEAWNLLGLNMDLVIEDSQKNWALIEPVLSDSGYLEASVRRRLSAFYSQLA